ncbi:MAG: sigma-70 family RNA polymerase sigma factor [Phycisphaerales bacterium]|nr:sigma-70 family RNA polymerase sigma factor [Phycisphaerales bacterium]
MQTTTHTSLLARLAEEQDDGAWADFCTRYGDLIRGFARRQGLQPVDCDDVLQNVLVKLTRSMPAFRYDPSKGKFRSYLKTVVLRCIFDISFQNRGERPVEDIEQQVRAASRDETVESAWEIEWRRHHLRQAMTVIETEFNTRDVAAFRSYAINGEDVHTAAATLSMSDDQVYKAKSRILKRICELVDQQVREEG